MYMEIHSFVSVAAVIDRRAARGGAHTSRLLRYMRSAQRTHGRARHVCATRRHKHHAVTAGCGPKVLAALTSPMS